MLEAIRNFFTCREVIDLKDHIELLERRLRYLKENYDHDLQKQVKAYQEQAHDNLVKEINFWMDQHHKLQLYIIELRGDKKDAI